MKDLLEKLRFELLDRQAFELAERVNWLKLPDLGIEDFFPVVQVGNGPPLLLLHGFDSSFLEFRRLAPLLANRFSLIIPDLFGFGFSPRPIGVEYDRESIINHLNVLFKYFQIEGNFGIIGASMGGAVALELARRFPEKVTSLLLLAPAGLTGRPIKISPLVESLGVWFLSSPIVRRWLCRQAFAYPDKSVGPPEEQIASLHLQCPRWGEALGSFSRSGGFAGSGTPLPSQPIHVILGKNDRILRTSHKEALHAILNRPVEIFEACGHLPHLDQPELVAERCIDHFL